ncbi:MAG: twin-arginine translocase subunit TatC [Armatimonadetes bacterium]|nr:twin-arginine translocase subunit TatC [Armatimonadota bacterium]
MTIQEHLLELRRRIIIVGLAWLAGSSVGYWQADRLLAVLLEPVTALGYQIIFIGLTEALLTKIKLSLFSGFLLSLSIILYQVWKFISPALDKEHRRPFGIFICASFLCFTGGVAFGFFQVYRLGVTFLLRFAGPELVPMLTIDKYVSFTISFLIPFGLLSEMPLAMWFLSRVNLITSNLLVRFRRYAILFTVGLAAVLTPTPDVMTCLLIALPLYALYEISIFIVRLVEKKKSKLSCARKVEAI